MKETTQRGTSLDPKIKECVCKHEYQDNKYGMQKRVMNPCNTKQKDIKWRCTVCGRVHD